MLCLMGADADAALKFEVYCSGNDASWYYDHHHHYYSAIYTLCHIIFTVITVPFFIYYVTLREAPIDRA